MCPAAWLCETGVNTGGGTVLTLTSNLNKPGSITLFNNFLYFTEEGNSLDGFSAREMAH